MLIVFVVLLAIHAQYGQARREGYPSTSLPAPPARRNVVVTFRGVLKQIKKKEILIQGDDEQLVTIRRNKATKFLNEDRAIKATDIDLETPVQIDATEDTDLKMVALNVKVGRRK